MNNIETTENVSSLLNKLYKNTIKMKEKEMIEKSLTKENEEMNYNQCIIQRQICVE